MLLDELTLSHGSHSKREDGVCIMEAVAWLANEQHSDQPQCASPVIRQLAMGLNDQWNDEDRQRLLPFAKLIVNTRDGLDDQRALMAFDWLCRVHVPAWLQLAGLTEEAASLREAAPFTDWSMLAEMTSRLEKAAVKSRAAGAAAWDAAGDAARDAAGAAARDAAGDAAGAAAWAAARDAAGAAAWAAAGAAARAAAGAAAWAAARNAAGDAAGAAAWAAARDAAGAAAGDAARAAARDAAGAAAGDFLQPTVRELQDSALDLLDRMCRLGDDREGI